MATFNSFLYVYQAGYHHEKWQTKISCTKPPNVASLSIPTPHGPWCHGLQGDGLTNRILEKQQTERWHHRVLSKSEW